MRITFVVPTYNRAHTVVQTVKSVLGQPYKNIEVLIVDDASTDCIGDALREFQGETRFRYIQLTRNQGQNAARNVGIDRATGDVITILDSDDEDMGNDLQPVIDLLNANPGIGGVFTGAVSKSSNKVLGLMHGSGQMFGAEGFLNGTYKGEYQAFLRKQYLEGPVFDENLGMKRSCTLLTWLRLAQQFKFMILNLKTRLYGDTGADRMGNVENIFRDAREIYRCNELVLERYGSMISTVSMAAYEEFRLNMVYYALLAFGRRRALQLLSTIKPWDALIMKYLAVLTCVALGARGVRLLRKHLG